MIYLMILQNPQGKIISVDDEFPTYHEKYRRDGMSSNR